MIVIVLLGIILSGITLVVRNNNKLVQVNTIPTPNATEVAKSPKPSPDSIGASPTPQVSPKPTPSIASTPVVGSPTPLPTPSPQQPSPQPVPQPTTDAATYRDYMFSTYGFTSTAQNFIKSNSSIRVKDLNGTCGGGFWIPWEKTVETNCAQHEATIHELSHAWWHTRRLQNPADARGLVRDLVRLADGDGSSTAVAFARGYVYGIGDWKGMYCTSQGCADVHNIQDSDFDLTESTYNAKIIDWEIYAGLSSWTMGKFKDGSHALPSYLWKYFEPEFTGTIQVTPYYDGGHS